MCIFKCKKSIFEKYICVKLIFDCVLHIPLELCLCKYGMEYFDPF